MWQRERVSEIMKVICVICLRELFIGIKSFRNNVVFNFVLTIAFEGFMLLVVQIQQKKSTFRPKVVQ